MASATGKNKIKSLLSVHIKKEREKCGGKLNNFFFAIINAWAKKTKTDAKITDIVHNTRGYNITQKDEFRKTPKALFTEPFCIV